MAFFSGTILFEAFNNQVDPVFWGTESVPVTTRNFQGWVYGVLGSTMAGWGIFMIFIAHYPFKMKEQWSWNCLFIGLLFWFVIDTAISLYFNVYFNAAFNSVIFILGLIPLFFTRNKFVQ
jgi:hypothetical protein